MTKKSLKLPITNVYAKGDYCATLHIGSEKTPVNLVLDSGSSTLVIKDEVYQASNDRDLEATSYAQEVNYGIGGWNGPLLNTRISIGHHDGELTLEQSHVALVTNKEQQKTFFKADGFLGLAYHHLNKSFDLTKFLKEQKINPEHTYPWPFEKGSNDSSQVVDASDLKAFKKFLWQHPEQDVKPYFTELEEHKLIANKFAFYSKRSSVHMNQLDACMETQKLDPLNQGYLILGGGEEHTDLYHGEFLEVKVEHDVYYNVELLSMQIGENQPVKAEPLDKAHQNAYLTNAIIDTGAGGIVLTAELYNAMIKQLIAINSSFEALLSPFKDIAEQGIGIDASLLKLEQWPEIKFTFVGEGEGGEKTDEVELTCKPDHYWQLNTPNFGKACFRFLSQLPQWPNQSIIGLPLLNNYYVVFDRSIDKTGVIKFAKQK